MAMVLNAERISELETVLGREQRIQLFAALEAQAAETGLAMRRQHAAGDERSLRREVHRLKGAAQIVGADRLIEAIEAIERCEPGQIDDGLLDAADTEIAALIAAVKLEPRT